MTGLAIHQLTATVHAEQADRAATLLRRVAADSLERAWHSVAVPPGHWCVRQLRVRLELRAESGDAGLQQQWAQSLVDALLGALRAGSPDVLHYQREADVLSDLLVSLCHRNSDRLWAWRRLGLVLDQGPDPAQRPADAAVAALAALPSDALVALGRTIAAAGFAAVHRLLGRGGWCAVADLVVSAAGVSPTAVHGAGEDAATPRRRRDHPAPAGNPAEEAAREPAHQSPSQTPDRTGSPAPIADRQLARTLAAGSAIARAARASGLRPDPDTAHAWAVLAIAEADPASLQHPRAGVLLAEVARLLVADLAGPGLLASTVGPVDRPAARGTTAPVPPRSAAEPAPLVENALSKAGQTAQPAVPEPADGGEPHAAAATEPDDRTGRPTEWGGLLFLLATAQAAGIPGELRADPALATRSLRWLLHQLGLLLVPAPADDPAVLACCGLAGDQPPPGGVPEDSERNCLTGFADRWLAVTAELLDEPVAEFRPRLRRSALVIAEPGWIELRMRADEVDLDVRRTGLDLDPGWVPWLGAVVRYVYL
ncbi:hypothetical protein [Jatrophihabitans sp.]|jgi:hypothetical protein|uniref:hypothetical protein n=1 Tax=Jatrophihabitans sp. TaxID=1932789 RepID=UPI002EE04C2D